MPKITPDDFIELCDSLADQFIEAAVKDISNPETRELITDAIDTHASKLLGVNVRAPFIHPFWCKFEEMIVGSATDFLGLAVISPPESVEAARDVLKEIIDTTHKKIDGKIDSLSDKLKARLASQAKTGE